MAIAIRFDVPVSKVTIGRNLGKGFFGAVCNYAAVIDGVSASDVEISVDFPGEYDNVVSRVSYDGMSPSFGN